MSSNWMHGLYMLTLDINYWKKNYFATDNLELEHTFVKKYIHINIGK